jgi:hypothetical protein
MQLTEELLGPDANNYGGAGSGKDRLKYIMTKAPNKRSAQELNEIYNYVKVSECPSILERM